MDLKSLIACAEKRMPCDLVIRNARIFNVFTGEIEEGEVALFQGRIAGVGKGYPAKEEYDAGGAYLLPGFLDAHIHVESSMLSPEGFAAAVVPHGTSGIVADPHEIVNVCGIAGAEYIKEAFRRLCVKGVCPLDVWLQLPSCVPATPFETSGAVLDGRETEHELGRALFFGLGEMMNFPAVLSAEEETLKKLEAAAAFGKVVDGHAPGLSGDALNAYRCAGIVTDHESLTPQECREKTARGFYVQIRCGSSANNIADAVQAVDAYNFRRYLLCSDDKNASDLLKKGHMDDALRRLVQAGMPASYAIPMATINVAECYGLKSVGAIAPGYFADMVAVKDLESFQVLEVFKRGIALMGEEIGKERYLPEAVTGTVKISLPPSCFRIIGRGGRFRVMHVLPHSLYTEERFVPAPVGELEVKGTGLCKLAVVERHFATGNVGLGLVQGFGFRGGAMGISVAHDSHNLVILGDDDRAMERVCACLAEAGGGMAIVSDEGEEVFPLEIAGLMSGRSLQEVASATAALSQKARSMGVEEGYEPFMTLAFLSLAVIPKLKLLDRGLFDLEKYSFVPLEERENG